MEKTPTTSRLLCYEGSTVDSDTDGVYSTSNFDSDEESEQETEDQSICQDDEDHVKLLLEKENVRFPTSPESMVFVNGDWIKDARKEAVKYIQTISQSNGFRRQTAYTAIAYHDAFLLRGLPVSGVEEHLILGLAAVACLTLASKYEEKMCIDFSMFPTTKTYEFDNQILQKTELMVLNKLNWRMHLLTPFEFTYYFVSKFSPHYQTTHSPSTTPIRDLTSKAEALIFSAIIEDENIMRLHKPSTIAAAAALLIIDEGLVKEAMEFKINALSLNAYLRTEEILPLYNQLRMKREKWETTSTPVPSSIPVLLQMGKENGDGDKLAVTSVCSAKRKSLTFSECGGESKEFTQIKRSC